MITMRERARKVLRVQPANPATVVDLCCRAAHEAESCAAPRAKLRTAKLCACACAHHLLIEHFCSRVFPNGARARNINYKFRSSSGSSVE